MPASNMTVLWFSSNSLFRENDDMRRTDRRRKDDFMQFKMSSREFDLLLGALAMVRCLVADNPAKEYDSLYQRFNALYFQIRDDVPIDVLYPKAYTKIKAGCGDSSSRP